MHRSLAFGCCVEREAYIKPKVHLYRRRQQRLSCRRHRDVGFDPVDAGPLRIARYSEPFSLLMAQLAYEGTAGPELAYRFERFGQ